jgi:glycosyltransferase involved in cell wall biosynthesis
MHTILKLADAASIHTVKWANAIAKRGWNVHLLSIRAPRELLDDAVTLHRAPWPAPWGYVANARFVREKVIEIRPDLIHAHYASGYGTLAGFADRHPLIVSVWGSDVFDFPTRSPLNEWLLRRALRKCDLLLSTSSAMAEQTSRFTDHNIGITPFGVDLQEFRPKKARSLFLPEDIVVGTVKGLVRVYGIEYLIRAFALLRARHSNLPLKLLLVGGGPQEAELKRLVRELGLTDVTVFTGRVNHASVPDFQNMLSVFVSVSLSESFGVAVIEASACAKPVVVSSVGGLPEVVEDGVTGFIVPPCDPVHTAGAIEKLVLDESLRERMGQAGRERVERLYEWEHCVDVMLEYYRQLLTSPRGTACAT